MSNVTPFPRPIRWDRLRTDEAETVIRARATPERTGAVVFTHHAWDRIDEREITRADVFEILRSGYVSEDPVRNEAGDWQVVVTKRIHGSREAGAVTVILETEERLVIRTVEWMDLR